MDSKVVLVTGGSGGIGSACCRVFSENGYTVVLHYNKNEEKAKQAAGGLTDCHLIQADLSQTEEMDKIYDLIKKDMNGRLDVLVNNAGVAFDNPLFSATPDEFEKTIQINMRSVWYLTKRLSRFMIRRKFGRVINMSSVVASMANPAQSIYSMTKAAIESFTRTISIELAQYNILVNSVAPGFIDTEMTQAIPAEYRQTILEKIPLGRMGEASEVAEMVYFLGNSGGYSTGSVFHVNGGIYHG